MSSTARAASCRTAARCRSSSRGRRTARWRAGTCGGSATRSRPTGPDKLAPRPPGVLAMRTLIVVTALLLPAAAFAAGGMKPGNYEYTTKMEMPGMPFAMPPMTAQHCLKQSDIDKNEQYRSDRSQDCEIKNLKQTAGKTTFDMACKDGTTGKAEYNVTADGMTGKTVLTREGQPMTMNMSAKRLGDCPK